MVAAMAGAAGAAAVALGAAAFTSGDAVAAAAAIPAADVAGGMSNCESSADYTWGRRGTNYRAPACDNPRVSFPAPAPRGANPYLLLTMVPLFWAGNWIIGRGLATDIPPMILTGIGITSRLGRRPMPVPAGTD
jgi:hypothetical protein